MTATGIRGRATMSPYQEGMWLAEILADGDGLNVLHTAFRIRGPFDATRFHRAVEQVVAAHPALWTTFPAGPDGPRAVRTQPSDPVRRVTVDGWEPSPAAATAVLTDVLHANRLSLAAGPGFQFVVVPAASDEHLVGLSVLHILIDQISILLLWEEIAAAYRSRCSRPPGTPSTGRWTGEGCRS